MTVSDVIAKWQQTAEAHRRMMQQEGVGDWAKSLHEREASIIEAILHDLRAVSRT